MIRFHIWRRILSSLRANLVAGIIVSVPVAISVWVIYAVTRLVDTPLRNVLKWMLGDKFQFDYPGVGIVFVLMVIFMVGFVTRTFVGGMLLRLGEWVFGHLPVVRTLYLGSKQLLSALLGRGEASFREVVLVEYPKKHSYVIGFVASRGKGQLATVNMEPILNVFVPTTPNPTSGFLILVPESRVKRLDMSVEDAVKFIISSGIVADDKGAETPTVFETPTSKIAVKHPPEGIHPDIRRLSDLVERGRTEENRNGNARDDSFPG